ncbi:hypothetical protein ACQPW1_32105 [Nocardia sp. CA-128927]|uniref:hypothetical protein n=1 Tax=Nocardia sp. CA-128927 TaxID=3239975 RepID=UPI003D976598
MHIRAAVATLGIGAGLAAIAVSAGAGQAAAVTPLNIPEFGLYGVGLDHSESVALRNSPLPGLLDPLWRANGVAIVIPLADEENAYYADFSGAVAASAASPAGEVSVMLLLPTPTDAPGTNPALLAFGFVE